jgi:glycosyltransferase involved in cell wall biosynthesis
MWPDIFVDTVPALARPLARLLLDPLFREARSACAGATAITGITEPFVEWGLKRGGRARSPLDRSFPMGYVSTPPAPEAIRKAEQHWDSLGAVASPSGFLVCFFGTLGRQLELETVLRAAKTLQSQGKPIRFVLCGSGDRLEHFRQVAAGLNNVLLPGWVDAAAIYALMRRSKVGLDPLPGRYDFLATINNKAIEYTSAGLPVISSPNRGVLAELLAREQCGLSYDDGDADALAGLLSQLCDELARVEQMSGNSARLFRRTFTAERVYGEMMAYLQRIATDGRQRLVFQRDAA